MHRVDRVSRAGLARRFGWSPGRSRRRLRVHRRVRGRRADVLGVDPAVAMGRCHAGEAVLDLACQLHLHAHHERGDGRILRARTRPQIHLLQRVPGLAGRLLGGGLRRVFRFFRGRRRSAGCAKVIAEHPPVAATRRHRNPSIPAAARQRHDVTLGEGGHHRVRRAGARPHVDRVVRDRLAAGCGERGTGGKIGGIHIAGLPAHRHLVPLAAVVRRERSVQHLDAGAFGVPVDLRGVVTWSAPQANVVALRECDDGVAACRDRLVGVCRYRT